MNGINARGGKWYSLWKHQGKRISYAIKLDVDGGGTLTPSASKKAAEHISEAWKHATLGNITRKQAEDALRAIPNLPPKVLNAALDRVRLLAVADADGNMPSIRLYLEEFRGDGSTQSETQRRGAFKKLLVFLGSEADRRLDSLSADTCRAFLREQLQLVSLGTVKHCLSYLSAAFNRAVDDEILNRNPFAKMELAKMGAAINPELGQDKTEKLPFSLDEMRLLCTQIASPWREMVLVAFLTGGQRMGDIACLRWEAVDFEKGLVSFATGKTGKIIVSPMVEPLRVCLQRLYDERVDAVHVFPEMACRYTRSKGALSTEFTAMLRALGIDTGSSSPQKGKRRQVSQKSFHSIRHAVVSMLRAEGSFSADVSRAIVGHDSEAVERAYFTTSEETKRGGLSFLADSVGLS